MINEFAKKIKKRRQELGLSLRKVCEAVVNEDGKSMSVSYLNDIEQGHRNPPGGRIIVKLAEILKSDPQELLNLAGKPDPIIEEASKEAEVAVVFRRIVEGHGSDPKFLDRIKAALDKEKKGQKDDAVGG